MKKIIEKEVHKGYEIGSDIHIHGHINDPDSWFITIRWLQIFGKRLCSKTCSEREIARYVNVELHMILNKVNSFINEVLPFT